MCVLQPVLLVPVVTVVPPVMMWECAGAACEVCEEGTGEESQWAWMQESRMRLSLHESEYGKK